MTQGDFCHMGADVKYSNPYKGFVVVKLGFWRLTSSGKLALGILPSPFRYEEDFLLTRVCLPVPIRDPVFTHCGALGIFRILIMFL